MCKSDNKKLKIGLFIATILVLVAALNLLFSFALGNIYFDLSAEQKYSLSDETVRVLRENKSAIKIKLYLSEKFKDADLEKHSKYVYKLLNLYAAKGKGFIDFSVVRVKPFTNFEVQAEKAGIREIDFNEEKLHQYLGASFTDSDGRAIVIPQFFPNRAAFIEDDITRTISILMQKNRKTIGVVSPVFNITEEKNALFFNDSWPFIKELEFSGYNVRKITDVKNVEAYDVDVLLVFYPDELSNFTVYGIDQYLMNGGRVIVFADAFSEEKFANKQYFVEYKSGLNNLLKKAGIAYSDNLIVGDNENRRDVVIDNKQTQYPFRLIAQKENFANHNIMKNVDKIYMNHSGYLEFEKVAGINTTVLLTTSENSGFMPATKLTDVSYENLVMNYKTTKIKYPLALLAEGKFNSVFSETQDENAFLSFAIKEAKLAVVADADMMSEVNWNNNLKDAGNPFAVVYSNGNIRFLRNLVDYMTESNLSNVAMTKSSKSNKTIAEVIQKKAEKKFEAKKTKVFNDLTDVEQKILREQNKNENVGSASVKGIKNLENLMRQKLKIQSELRKVRYDVERVYNIYMSLFFILFILIWPTVVVTVAWILYYLYDKYLKQKAEDLIHE